MQVTLAVLWFFFMGHSQVHVHLLHTQSVISGTSHYDFTAVQAQFLVLVHDGIPRLRARASSYEI